MYSDTSVLYFYMTGEIAHFGAGYLNFQTLHLYFVTSLRDVNHHNYDNLQGLFANSVNQHNKFHYMVERVMLIRKICREMVNVFQKYIHY